MPVPKILKIPREVWHFKGAAWCNLRIELKNWSWEKLKYGSVDAAVNYFLDSLMSLCSKYIPRSVLEERKSTHPWIDQKCEAAIAKKNQAEGSDAFELERNK